MMTEIQTIEGGQKDVLLRGTNIKQNVYYIQEPSKTGWKLISFQCNKLVQGFRVTCLFTGQYNTKGYDTIPNQNFKIGANILSNH